MLYVYRIATACILFVCGSAWADKIHDPTAPKFVISELLAKQSNPQSADSEELVLQGVVTKKSRKMAIIANNLYQVGDQVNSYKIKEINKDSVVLTGAGSEQRLYVYEQ